MIAEQCGAVYKHSDDQVWIYVDRFGTLMIEQQSVHIIFNYHFDLFQSCYNMLKYK